MASLTLGDADRYGQPSSLAWRDVGYDLDDRATTSIGAPDVCSPITGGDWVLDGNDGRDNAFGEIILPEVDAATRSFCSSACPDDVPTLSGSATKAISAGSFTLQIRVSGWSGAPNDSVAGVTADVFTSGAYDNGVPLFDATTDWPVQPESLVDSTSLATANAHFAAAYVADGVFVAGENENVTLAVRAIVRGYDVTIPIHHAVLAMRAGAANPAFFGGIIAGVLDPQELIDIARSQFQSVATHWCGADFDNVASVIESAMDILGDRTNARSMPCSAISIGIQFEAVPIANPTKIGPATPPPVSLCNGG